MRSTSPVVFENLYDLWILELFSVDTTAMVNPAESTFSERLVVNLEKPNIGEIGV
jgi:hypothetical protein